MPQLGQSDLSSILDQSGAPPPLATPPGGQKPSDALVPTAPTKLQVDVATKSRGPEQAELIFNAVKQIEGRGLDMSTPAVRAAGGAISGITPASAIDLGYKPEDRNDYDKALAMQRAEVSKYHEKYGNWQDALVAFDWGPGNADKWIAKGRPTSLLPKETVNYLDKASRLTGINLQSGPEGSYVPGKRVGTRQDLGEILDRSMQGPTPGTAQESEEQEGPDEAQLLQDEDQIRGPSLGEPGEAFLAGALREPLNLVLGPTQTALQVGSALTGGDEEAARAMTAKINDLDERLGVAEQQRKHPNFYTMGGIVGTTAAVMASAGMLGATSVGSAVTESVGALSRLSKLGLASLGGAAALGTTFHPDLGEGNRYLEATLGAVLGPASYVAAQGIGWSAKYLATKEAFQKMLATLQASVGEWSRNTSGVKDAMLTRYKALTAEADARYAIRDVAGNAFEGFDPEELAAAIARAVPREAREQGISTVVTTNSVRRELGLDAHEAAKRSHEEALEQYAKEKEAYERAVDKIAPSAYGPSVREQIIAQSADILPSVPTNPGVFQAAPVGSERFSAALQSIHRATQSKQLDPQSRHQLAVLGRELLTTAEQQAERLGMNGKDFLRRSEEANKFFAENIGPIRDMFNKATPNQIARGYRKGKTFTNADFADRVSSVLKTNDVEKMAMLGKVLGEGAKPEMQKVVEFEMLQTLTDGMKGEAPTRAASKRFTKYINDRKDGLIEMLGRQRVTELEGMAKLAEHMSAKNIEHKMWSWGTRSLLPFIGAERVAEGIWKGRPLEGLREGVGFILAPFAVHALHNMMVKLHAAPRAMSAVRSMAKLKPDTPEFEKAVKQLEAQVVGRSVTAGRVGVQEGLEGGPSDQ